MSVDRTPAALLLRRVSFQNGHVNFRFRSGETVTKRLTDLPELRNASPKAIRNYRILGRGMVAHWPELDTDIAASHLLGVSEEDVARAAGQDLRAVTADELIREGETKQDIANDVAALVRKPRRALARGSKYLRAMLEDIIDGLELDIDRDQNKTSLAKTIVEAAGLEWTSDCDATRSKSGGGGTITRVGLQRLRDAVKILGRG